MEEPEVLLREELLSEAYSEAQLLLRLSRSKSEEESDRMDGEEVFLDKAKSLREGGDTESCSVVCVDGPLFRRECTFSIRIGRSVAGSTALRLSGRVDNISCFGRGRLRVEDDARSALGAWISLLS